MTSNFLANFLVILQFHIFRVFKRKLYSAKTEIHKLRADGEHRVQSKQKNKTKQNSPLLKQMALVIARRTVVVL